MMIMMIMMIASMIIRDSGNVVVCAGVDFV